MVYKIGSKGDVVKLIQEKIGITNPDGDFGSGTEAKVKKWQLDNGLDDDGIVGANTLQKMGIDLSQNSNTVESKNALDITKLKGIVPDYILDQLPESINKFEINTPLRLSHFLSNCDHESGGFKVTVENLNYSSNRLLVVFPYYFKSIDESNKYAGNQQKIASKIYGSRMGNGDESTLEGWKYRGRGYIQLTGKSNYASFDKYVDDDIVNNPDLVATKYPLLSAAFFWDFAKLNSLADKGSDDIAISYVRKRINGGINGIDEVKLKFQKYYNILK